MYIFFFSRKVISPTKPSSLIAIITAYIMIVIINNNNNNNNNICLFPPFADFSELQVGSSSSLTTTRLSLLTSPFSVFTYLNHLCLLISELFLDTSATRSPSFRRTHSSTGEVEVIKLLSFVG